MKSIVSRFSKFIWDFSGAFGDIGVLFPLAISLIAKNGFNPTALFLAAGLFYIASSLYFRITMPVQPLKAMSAIAIASGMTASTIQAAGLAMGLILLILAATRWSVRLGAFFPTSVIRGIQLGLGIILIRTSAGMITSDPRIAAMGLLALAIGLLAQRFIPPLIPLLALGIGIAIKEVHLGALGPAPFTLTIPTPSDLWLGLVTLVLPQIALTFGNAIVATEATAKSLFGNRAARLNLTSIPVSMGIANVATSILGGVPMCHGCGGLTAHAKFGAKSERSGLIIGAFLITLALLFGNSALNVISAFPVGVLGVLLFSVGVLHAAFVRDILSDRFSMAIASLTAIAGVVGGNLTIGFGLGIVVHYATLTARKRIHVHNA